MAQPVFDGHPLEEYFIDSGEASEPMPGGIADQPYLTGSPSVFKHAERMEKLCFLIFGAVESLTSFFSHRIPQRTQAFAERFKYGVISSSLLSPAFPVTPMVEPHRRTTPPSLPGRLPNTHSRTPSAAESVTTDNISLSMPPEPETPVWPLTVSFTVAVAALSARFYFFALLLLAATLYYMHVHRLDIHPKPDVMTPSLSALQHLIAAGRLWDTMINDTFTMLENEEQSVFYGPTSPRTPSSSLRVALSTSLLTTQTQCDNVRQLLSAITSPSELSQLAEMYAPPSPIKPTFARSSDSHRPLSHPGLPPRTTPSTDRSRKRSTWNGSYTSLALAGTPPPLTQRREKRRSDLNALLGSSTSPTPARTRSRNALSSPPQPLADVSEGEEEEEEEEEEGMVTAESSLVEDEEENSFGTAALGLYRNRVREGLRALELSSQRGAPLSLTRGQSTRRRSTMSPGSKYTSMQTARHPLSLSSLRQTLQNALASKRFACSHLLALRFEDDEDDVYWEDVRAVMSLLTSTLIDASSGLSEVLDDVEERHLDLDLNLDLDCHVNPNLKTTDAPTPPASESASGLDTPSSLASPPRTKTRLPPAAIRLEYTDAVVPSSSSSFAPTPSHLARFASHVEAISTAMDDAREQLARCVASLKEERATAMHSPGHSHSSHPSTSSCGDATAATLGVPSAAGALLGPGGSGATMSALSEPSEHPAIQAYERVRRELGLALRECERGRERLVHVVAPPPTPSTSEELGMENVDVDGDGDGDGEGEGEGREASDEPRMGTGTGDRTQDTLSPHPTTANAPDPEPGPSAGDDENDDDDDNDPAQSLAPPGIEQVFEADSEVGVFARARSRLTREERLCVVRAKRAGRTPSAPASARELEPEPERERWGPSGDVVQELKDVIWKVSERRRRWAEGVPPGVVSSSSS